MEEIVGRKLSVHQEHELLLRLEVAGLSSELAQKVIESEGLATAVVRTIKHGGFQGNSRYLMARETMGRNFLGIEEASGHYGVVFSRDDLAALADIPFSQSLIEQYKETHLLVAGFPLSLRDMNSITKRKGVGVLSETSCWWQGQEFVTKEKVRPRWYLLRKDLVEGSISESSDRQDALVPEKEEIPKACDLVYAVVLYFMATGERSFPDRYHARSSSKDEGRRAVCVGEFKDHPKPQLSVTSFTRGSLNSHGFIRYDGVGITTARYAE